MQDAASDNGDRTTTNSSSRHTPQSITTRASIFQELRTGLESSKQSLRSSIDFISTQIQTAKEHYNSRIAQRSGNALEPREVHPRMPWHDVQASVTGLAARDVAAHFVQVIFFLLVGMSKTQYF